MSTTTPRILEVARQEVVAIPERCDGYHDDLVMALDTVIREQNSAIPRQRQEQITKIIETIAGRVLDLAGRDAD